MKKVFLVVSLMLIGLTTANAQATAEKKHLTVEEKAEIKKMQKEANVDLTPEQKEKLKAIRQENKGLTKEEKKAKKEETKAKVDAILTPDQKERRKEIQKKRKELRNN